MIAFLRAEPGGEVVREILQADGNHIVAHSINLCEVYYDFFRADGEATAEEVLEDLFAAGVRANEDISPQFYKAAGRIKADKRRISLADCFAVALAESIGGTVLTADHHEFDPLVGSLSAKIQFIR